MSIFLIYFAYLVTRYPEVEANSVTRTDVPGRCKIIVSSINGLHCNRDELVRAVT